MSQTDTPSHSKQLPFKAVRLWRAKSAALKAAQGGAVGHTDAWVRRQAIVGDMEAKGYRFNHESGLGGEDKPASYSCPWWSWSSWLGRS